ncbi:Calcium-translocating P-type ATPase [Phytophthora megakarya]|uniref:Calcium-translocating P-type ATPase n=1 Tax=Phytophthora megakarya TaxID=4795 RepID=A0A225VS11_9STRA|nr:Calcium-translocating P-type ATPase [Phytophthora megakarya]
MDESAMTGESDLLVKNVEHPFLLSGTKVMEGLGKMLVVANIEDEVYVEIATPKNAMVDIKDEQDKVVDDSIAGSQSSLEGKLYNLTILISKFAVLVALLVFVVMSIHFSIDTFGREDKPWKSGYVNDYMNYFIIAITVLAVAIPEGLPLAVTISLAYSVKKMLVDNNLVRHLDACETMGSATTVGSDKTGMLTTNRMTVMQLWIGDNEFSSATDGIGALVESTKEAFCKGIAVENGLPEHSGNKTECALLQYIRDGGLLSIIVIDIEKCQALPEIRANNEIVHILTFSSAKKRMSVVVRRRATTCRVYTKGATEVVLGLCQDMQRVDGSIESLDNARKEKIGADVIEKYASQAYRTLCLAYLSSCRFEYMLFSFSH